MVVLVLKEGSTWVRKGTKAVQSVSWAAIDLNDKHNIWSFTKISGTEHLLCFYLVSHIHGDLQPLRTLTILWQNQHHLLSSFTNHHLQIKSSLHQTSPPSNLPFSRLFSRSSHFVGSGSQFRSEFSTLQFRRNLQFSLHFVHTTHVLLSRKLPACSTYYLRLAQAETSLLSATRV